MSHSLAEIWRIKVLAREAEVIAQLPKEFKMNVEVEPVDTELVQLRKLHKRCHISIISAINTVATDVAAGKINEANTKTLQSLAEILKALE